MLAWSTGVKEQKGGIVEVGSGEYVGLCVVWFERMKVQAELEPT